MSSSRAGPPGSAPLRARLNRVICDCPIRSLRRVVCVEVDTSALDAFRTLVIHDVTSLPIVSATGEVCGIISATDALQVGARDDVLLTDPVATFLGASRRAAGIGRPAHEVVRCRKEDTLAHALDLMLSNSVHDVYVVDDDRGPEGVVSFVDILNECARTQ
eukprot:792975-Prymnesium_polylepis.1